MTDRARSVAFYEALGFRLDAEHSSATALEIVNEFGVRMNLILNGEPTARRDNVLMDRPEKWPGYSHAVFIVDRLSETLDWAARKNVTITEGPIDWGRNARVAFTENRSRHAVRRFALLITAIVGTADAHLTINARHLYGRNVCAEHPATRRVPLNSKV